MPAEMFFSLLICKQFNSNRGSLVLSGYGQGIAEYLMWRENPHVIDCLLGL